MNNFTRRAVVLSLSLSLSRATSKIEILNFELIEKNKVMMFWKFVNFKAVNKKIDKAICLSKDCIISIFEIIIWKLKSFFIYNLCYMNCVVTVLINCFYWKHFWAKYAIKSNICILKCSARKVPCSVAKILIWNKLLDSRAAKYFFLSWFPF